LVRKGKECQYLGEGAGVETRKSFLGGQGKKELDPS